MSVDTVLTCVECLKVSLHFQLRADLSAATAMRRASNRMPKRSLDTDFELTHAVTNPKGRAGARRGPTGPSKARKATFTTSGAIIPQTQGLSNYLLPCRDQSDATLQISPWQHDLPSTQVQPALNGRKTSDAQTVASGIINQICCIALQAQQVHCPLASVASLRDVLCSMA